MVNIRKGSFETNSSSAHSIVITKHEVPYSANNDFRLNSNFLLVRPYNIEFGRTFDILADWYSRMCYAIASFGAERFDEIEAAIKKHFSNIEFIDLPTDPWGDEDDTPYYGSVDHQSMGLLESFLKKHNITIEDFIFNNHYVVIIDGDEYMIFDTLRRNELLNMAAIEEIYD